MNGEYVPGNKKVLIFLVTLLVIYIGFRLNVEPIVNYLISYNHDLEKIDIDLAGRQEELKLVLQTVLLAAPPIIFYIFIGWISYRMVRARSIPPKSIHFPFGMKILIGREAVFIGYVGIVASLLQVLSSIYVIWNNYSLVTR